MSKEKLGELMDILSDGVSSHHVSADEPLPACLCTFTSRLIFRVDAYVFAVLNREQMPAGDDLPPESQALSGQKLAAGVLATYCTLQCYGAALHLTEYVVNILGQQQKNS